MERSRGDAHFSANLPLCRSCHVPRPLLGTALMIYERTPRADQYQRPPLSCIRKPYAPAARPLFRRDLPHVPASLAVTQPSVGSMETGADPEPGRPQRFNRANLVERSLHVLFGAIRAFPTHIGPKYLIPNCCQVSSLLIPVRTPLPERSPIVPRIVPVRAFSI